MKNWLIKKLGGYTKAEIEQVSGPLLADNKKYWEELIAELKTGKYNMIFNPLVRDREFYMLPITESSNEQGKSENTLPQNG